MVFDSGLCGKAYCVELGGVRVGFDLSKLVLRGVDDLTGVGVSAL